MINETVARRYAKGLLGAALEKSEPLEPLVEHLGALAAAVEGHSGLESLLLNGGIDEVIVMITKLVYRSMCVAR